MSWLSSLKSISRCLVHYRHSGPRGESEERPRREGQLTLSGNASLITTFLLSLCLKWYMFKLRTVSRLLYQCTRLSIITTTIITAFVQRHKVRRYRGADGRLGSVISCMPSIVIFSRREAHSDLGVVCELSRAFGSAYMYTRITTR